MRSREIRSGAHGNVIEADESPCLVGPSVSEVLLPHVSETLPNCVTPGHKVTIVVPGPSSVLVLSNSRVRVGTIGGYSQRVVELVSADPVVWQFGW